MRILFDLDGTLVNSAPSLCFAANKMLKEYGRGPVAVSDYLGFVGQGMVKQIERALEFTGGPVDDFDAAYALFRRFYDADPISRTTLYEDVSSTLDDLVDAGHRLGVCTQKVEAPAREVLEAFALSPPIAALTAGDMIGALKPDPAMVEHCAAQLGDGPLKHVVFVGDSETDAQTAVNAGVPFLLHSKGYRHGPVDQMTTYAVFESWDEVPAIIAGMSAG